MTYLCESIHFSSSLYIINQKPMIHRTDLHCITTWVARSSGWNLPVHLLILWFRFHCPDGAIIQYKFLFSLQDQTVPHSSLQA